MRRRKYERALGRGNFRDVTLGHTPRRYLNNASFASRIDIYTYFFLARNEGQTAGEEELMKDPEPNVRILE